MPKTCANCKWASFQMTNHRPPRINPKYVGECKFPLPTLPPLPLSVTHSGYGKEDAWRTALEKGYILPYKEGCPTFEEKGDPHA